MDDDPHDEAVADDPFEASSPWLEVPDEWHAVPACAPDDVVQFLHAAGQIDLERQGSVLHWRRRPPPPLRNL